MDILLPSATYKLENMSEDELCIWFQKWIKRYYKAKVKAWDKAIHLSCLRGAFDEMELSLWQNQHRTTLEDEFEYIFTEFSPELQKKFRAVLGRSIKELIKDQESAVSKRGVEKPKKNEESHEIIIDIIELALSIKFYEMADILA